MLSTTATAGTIFEGGLLENENDNARSAARARARAREARLARGGSLISAQPPPWWPPQRNAQVKPVCEGEAPEE
jgi:hypothetical protein